LLRRLKRSAPRRYTPKLPTPALKLQQEELDAIGTASSINADLGGIANQIDSGNLDLSAASNAAGTVRNMIGISNENSRNLASFKSTLEKLRNDSLRLNKGVQTEGDAQRAWNELVANINDKGVVKQRLAEIQKINERAVNLRKMNVDSIRTNFGLEPMDTGGYEKQPPQSAGAVKAFRALPLMQSLTRSHQAQSLSALTARKGASRNGLARRSSGRDKPPLDRRGFLRLS
jgi:hypothetical protein